MSIESLALTHLRCFSNHTLQLSPGFNLFIGQNGSGKTSLLEAVYYLGRAKSFKTHLPRRLVQRDQTHFSVFARVTGQEGVGTVPLGIRYTTSGETCLRINGETVSSRAELAKLLPIQLINTESYRLIDSGPAPRREFLDWCVFHVKHEFLGLWRRARHQLKQRNAAIKRGDHANIVTWNAGLAQMGEALHTLRHVCFEWLLAALTPLLAQLLPDIPISLHYYRGWPADAELAAVLSANLAKDIALGYTSAGPHRSDIVCRVHGVPAQDVLSRGQQKLLVIALHLAQGRVFNQHIGQQAVYLVDDVAAELDPRHRAWVLQALQALGAQVLLTAIERTDLVLPVPTNDIHLPICDVSRETCV